MESKVREKDYDVIISGGGAVGLTLALGLVQTTNLRIGIIEPNPANIESQRGKTDSRVIALSMGSKRFLSKLGVDKSEHETPIRTVHVSDRGHLGHTRLHHNDYQVDALGYVIRLNHLTERLTETLNACRQDIRFFSAERIESIASNTFKKTLLLQSGNTITTRLLVVAEGADSKTKAMLGMDTNTISYQQSAIIFTVTSDQEPTDVAYERFTQSGPLAMLPMERMGQHQSQFSVVWVVDNQQTQQLMTLGDERFLMRLQSEFGYRAGNFVSVSSRFSLSVDLKETQDSLDHRSVLVGNSAQTLHPIAGQGLNLGLRDVENLISQLKQAHLYQSDPGDYQLLRAFKKTRRLDRQKTILATDALVRFFSNNNALLTKVRNFGLISLNFLPDIRENIAIHAMGLNQSDQLRVQ
jgi:2-octaprenyl-6-methoxyphenol hydroxylase